MKKQRPKAYKSPVNVNMANNIFEQLRGTALLLSTHFWNVKVITIQTPYQLEKQKQPNKIPQNQQTIRRCFQLLLIFFSATEVYTWLNKEAEKSLAEAVYTAQVGTQL